MNAFTTFVASICLGFAATCVMAQDTMKKDDAMSKKMTMEDCKDHMAMAKKEGAKKDDAMMKKDQMCADMMKKDGMGKNDMGKGAAEPMNSDSMKK